MKTLCLSTASSFTAIALFDGTELLAENSWVSNNDEAEKLMPAIADLLNSPKTSYSDLQKVIVVNGPGSFTGLRIGVSVANTIAYLTNAKLYSLTTFDFWHTLTDLPILIFAGKGGVYLSEKGNSEGDLINLPEINDTLAAKKISEYFGDITDEQKEAIAAKFTDLDFTFGEIMKKAIAEAPLKEAQIVKPLYIKKPAITKSNKPTICFT